MKQKHILIAVLLTLLLTGYQLIRIITFAQVYGGVEHDGGWMLSISRSLAEQGTYTTMVSTLADPQVSSGVGVDQKFDIQADDGRIWFFTGNGIGPASIIPDAVVLKLFGSGFWALKSGPLLFYTLFLLLTAYILYQLAGWTSLLFFHAFIFFYPHISIFLSYEAMGEVPSMFYILLAFITCVWALSRPIPRWPHFFLAGLTIGLALNAKLITLWSLSGIGLWVVGLWMWGWMKPPPSIPPRGGEADSSPPLGGTEGGRAGFRPLSFPHLLSLGLGAILPTLLWELVHLVILTQLTDFAGYQQHGQQRLRFILDDGSGVGVPTHSGSEFFWDKFFVLAEVTPPQRWAAGAIFVIILLGGAWLLWHWRKEAKLQAFLAFLWLGWLMNTAWFVTLAKTGWVRHFWFGLVLALMLLSVITVNFVRMGLTVITIAEDQAPSMVKRPQAVIALIAATITIVLLGWGFMTQSYALNIFLPDEIVSYWQQKQIDNKYGASLPWIIIPRQAQAEVVAYIHQMPAEARVYYPGAHKSAEIPPQTGRVQYPLNRLTFSQPHPSDIVLIGPSLISPWQDPVRRQSLLELVSQNCPAPLLKNDYYMICPIAGGGQAAYDP